MRDITRDRRHADESVQNSVRTHGLIVVGGGVLAFVVCLVNFALGQVGAGVAAVIVVLLAFGVGLSWRAMDSRRRARAVADRGYCRAARFFTDLRTSDRRTLATSFPTGPLSTPPFRSAVR